jgi:hypothetical protein
VVRYCGVAVQALFLYIYIYIYIYTHYSLLTNGFIKCCVPSECNILAMCLNLTPSLLLCIVHHLLCCLGYMLHLHINLCRCFSREIVLYIYIYIQFYMSIIYIIFNPRNVLDTVTFIILNLKSFYCGCNM